MANELTVLYFSEASIRKLELVPGRDDAGYELKGKMRVTANFSYQLAQLLRCEKNFYDDSWNYLDGVSSAGLQTTLDSVECVLLEGPQMKKAAPLLTLPEVSVNSFSVYDEDGAPRISMTLQFKRSLSAAASFLVKHQFFHGDLTLTGNQTSFDFGDHSSHDETAEAQMPLEEEKVSDMYGVESETPAKAPAKKPAKKASKPAAKKVAEEKPPKKGKRA